MARKNPVKEIGLQLLLNNETILIAAYPIINKLATKKKTFVYKVLLFNISRSKKIEFTSSLPNIKKDETKRVIKQTDNKIVRIFKTLFINWFSTI